MSASSVTRWWKLSRQPARPGASRPRVRPQVEALEDRQVPAIIVVTTAADDLTPNDGSVSLREAIQAVNNGNAVADPDISNQNPGVFGVNDTIKFNISASGTVQTISVGSTGNGALPQIIKPMTINGYSEQGASMNTLANGDDAKILIELNGSNAGPNADGLLIGPTGAGSTIEGLAINRFSLNGIELQGGGCTIAGNFVGTNPQGNAAEPNQNDGIHISSSSSIIIGGTTPGARDIVSGNQLDGIHIVGTTASPATGNIIEGNFVGVNAAGTGSVGIKATDGFAGTPGGNFDAGIEISGGDANTIGGATAVARNVVGLNAAGIEVDNGGQNNVIQGNFVGAGADGVTAVGNNLQGIALRSSDNLSPPLGPGQTNEPAVSGNIIGLNPNLGFSGLGNLVEFNGAAGIAVLGSPLPNNAKPIQNSGNSILGNSIFENGRSNTTFEAGIDLSNGFVFPKDDGVTANDSRGHGAANDPNNFQNFPVLTSISADGTTIVGTLNQSASPNVKYRIEFFVSNSDPLNGVEEGQNFLGAATVTSNSLGSASFTFTAPTAVKPGQIVTATATNLTADLSSQAGANNVFNTSEISAGISIEVPPSITSSSSVTFTMGTLGSFNVTATGVPTPALSAGVLPGGVQFVDHGDGTATLSGTPTAAGQFGITITASNGVQPDAVESLTLTVLPAPGPGPGPGPDPGPQSGPSAALFAVGADVGGGPEVKVYDAVTNQLRFDFFAYDPHFTGGARVAVGDVTGDGTPDVVTGAGPGGGPQVNVYDGKTGALLRSFFAYDPHFTGGVNVAVGDVNGDGFADIITGTGVGGGPQVNVFDGRTGALLRSFFAYEPTFRGGVNVAAGDVTGDGKADIITGTGFGGGPRVQVFDGVTGEEVLNFFAYESSFRGGVNVAAGDVNGDGKADIVTGTGVGGGPAVSVFDGATGSQIGRWLAFDPGFRGGVAVETADVDAAGKAEVLVAPGAGTDPVVRVLDGTTGVEVREVQVFGPSVRGVGVTTGDGTSVPSAPPAPPAPPPAAPGFDFSSAGVVGDLSVPGLL
jgi:CSLREA domain-containing protein